MKSIKIALLYPDILNLQGEHYNIRVLSRIAKLNNIILDIEKIKSDTRDFSPLNYDLLLMGVGELSSIPLLKRLLYPLKKDFTDYIKNGKPMLVSGTTISLFGKTIKREEGSFFEEVGANWEDLTEKTDIIDGLGIIPLNTKENSVVYGDDLMTQARFNNKDITLIGSQIQMVDFELIDETKAFAKVIYGYGNNGRDRTEGVILNNAIFTNMLGPILLNNPPLAIELLKIAGNLKDEEIELDMSWELLALKDRQRFILQKESDLKNCNTKDVDEITIYGYLPKKN